MKLRHLSIVCLLAMAGTLGAVSAADAEWTQLTGFPQQEVLDLEVAGSWLYAASLDSVYRGQSGGTSLVPVGSAGQETDIRFLHFVGPRMLAGTFGFGVYESTDSGFTWTARNAGLVGAEARSVSCLASRGDSVYIGTSGAGVFVASLKGIISWQPFRDSLLSNVAWDVYSLFEWEGMLFTGAGQNGYVFRNLPALDYWQTFRFNENIGGGLAMLGMDHDVSGTLLGAAFNGLYTSRDSGATWSYFPAPFGAALSGRIVQTGSRTLAMLSHATQGTLLWERKGGTWDLLNHQPGLLALDVVYFDNRLYAGCLDGLWYFPLNPTDVGSGEPLVPAGFSLSQNYPNPFNMSTTIEFSLPRRGQATLTIYNILGERLRTLISDNLPAGTYRVHWDGLNESGSPVASGVYLYELRAGEITLSEKMVVLK